MLSAACSAVASASQHLLQSIHAAALRPGHGPQESEEALQAQLHTKATETQHLQWQLDSAQSSAARSQERLTAAERTVELLTRQLQASLISRFKQTQPLCLCMQHA